MNQETWEHYGKEDPYFGVITDEKFRQTKLNAELLDEFLVSGIDYVDRIWSDIETINGGKFSPERTIDFGCGVGRLVIPLAARSKEAVGVDISDSMLEEARRNSKTKGLSNIDFVKSDPELSNLKGEFDLIHTFIVIQHIPADLGYRYFEQMLKRLKSGGIGVIHLTYKIEGSLMSRIYRDFPLVYKIRRMIKGGDKFLIPMYGYDLNKIFEMLQINSCHKCLVKFTYHSHKGVILTFKKEEGIFE
jgi:SAM-dependent methyltransferase